METSLYALERLVADRLARAHADAARRSLISSARFRAGRPYGRSRPGALRARLGAAVIALGMVLVGDGATSVGTRRG